MEKIFYLDTPLVQLYIHKQSLSNIQKSLRGSKYNSKKVKYSNKDMREHWKGLSYLLVFSISSVGSLVMTSSRGLVMARLTFKRLKSGIRVR